MELSTQGVLEREAMSQVRRVLAEQNLITAEMTDSDVIGMVHSEFHVLSNLVSQLHGWLVAPQDAVNGYVHEVGEVLADVRELPRLPGCGLPL